MRAGERPAARWGFHALDARWARRLVADAGIAAGHLVLDLGAGAGALTAPLVGAGARVIAVELHPARAALLRERFALDDVRVVQCDLRSLRLPRGQYRAVANPPYAVAQHVLHALLRSPSLERADLVVPRWLARRWASHTPRVRIGRSVPAEAFRPAARTGAAVAIVSGQLRR